MEVEYMRTISKGFRPDEEDKRIYTGCSLYDYEVHVMPSVKDVNQHDFVKELAAFLKRSGKMKVPECTDLVKLAKFKELAPYDKDWYFIRAASVARHLYIRSGTGVGAFTKMYGGRKRRGTTPSIFCKADRGVIRRVLQSLEGLKLVEKDGNGGRKLTQQGRRDMDRIATQIIGKAKPVAAV